MVIPWPFTFVTEPNKATKMASHPTDAGHGATESRALDTLSPEIRQLIYCELAPESDFPLIRPSAATERPFSV